MRILVVGSGGREHALCWKLAQSPVVTVLFCAPGSDGIASVAEIVPVDVLDLAGLVAAAQTNHIDLVVVGPEAPLAAGLVDRFEEAGIKAFGPSKAAARLESSKAFMKSFAQENGIPTAEFRHFSPEQAEQARAYVADHPLPVVVKADGLAAGKGVTVAQTHLGATLALNEIFGGKFGGDSRDVIVEEFLVGEEASLFAICDGRTAIELGTAQDHKRAFDGDVGPNTGGMGAYSPAPNLPPDLIEQVMTTIVDPTVNGMAKLGAPFVGFLFVGLMIGSSGPKLVEFNARFGDPECQVVMPRLDADLARLLDCACDGRLGQLQIGWRELHALTVVMAATGYPGTYRKGTEIDGLDRIDDPNVMVFHAGTRLSDRSWTAQGGRVLSVTAVSPTLQGARNKAYAAAGKIHWDDGYYRTDIGWRGLRQA